MEAEGAVRLGAKAGGGGAGHLRRRQRDSEIGSRAWGGGLGKVTSYQSARGWGELEPGGDELPAKRGTAHLGDCVDHDPRDDLMHGSRIAPGESGQHLAAVNGAEDAGDARHQYRGRGGAERGLERSFEGGGMGRDQKTPVTHGVDLSRGSGRARGGKAGCTHPELYASLLVSYTWASYWAGVIFVTGLQYFPPSEIHREFFIRGSVKPRRDKQHKTHTWGSEVGGVHTYPLLLEGHFVAKDLSPRHKGG